MHSVPGHYWGANNPLWITFALALSLITEFSFAQKADSSYFGSKPNIIHILADDLGYDDLKCYGAKDIATPNIDKLAKSGVLFSDFYAPSSVCTPSRAAILTGKYSFKVEGCDFILFPHDIKGADPKKEKLISRVLKEQGYTTALVGKWHMGSQPEFLPTKHGFDYFFGLPYCNDHGPERNSKEKYGYEWPPIPLMEGTQIIEQPVDLFSLPERFTNKVCEFIERSKDHPFFIHYANIETHTPWYVPTNFQGKSKIGAYGDAVQMLDWSVGQIVGKLKELGLLENTLIVFSSDNGPLYATSTEFIKCYGEFGRVNVSRKHLLRAGKGRAEFEGGNRVPAIFSWDGTIPKGKRTSEVAGGIDLYATFGYLAGIPQNEMPLCDGINIFPILVDPDKEKSPHEIFLSFMGQNLHGLRKGEWKLSVDNLNFVRLFNVVDDPGEKNDLASEFPEKMFELIELAESKSKEMGFIFRYR